MKVFYRTLISTLQFTKRNFSAATAHGHGHVKKARKVVEPEPDVEIAWASVIYRTFFLTGYVLGPVYILSGGLSDPPPYIPSGQTAPSSHDHHGHGHAAAAHAHH